MNFIKLHISASGLRASAVLVSAFFFSSICQPALADAIITVSPGSQVTTSTGTTTQVDLTVSGLTPGGVPSLGTYDVTLSFDPALLSFSSIKWGTGLDVFGLGDIQTITTSTGSVELFEVSLDSPTDLNAFQSGSFLLDSLYFTGLNTGLSNLNLAVNAAGDANGAPLPVTVAYQSSVSPTPEPSTWLLLMTGLGALGIRSGAYGREA